MARKRDKLIIITTIIALLVTSTAPAWANTTNNINSLTEQRDSLNDEKKDIEQQIKNSVVEKNKVLKDLEKINQQLNDVQTSLDDLNEQIKLTEENIVFTTAEIENKQRDYDGRMAIFEQRLVDMYAYGDVDFLEVLLQATSLKDFLTRFEYLKYIANNDQRMLEEVLEMKKQLEEQKIALEEMKVSLEANKQEQIEKSKELEVASSQKKEIVAEINAEQDLMHAMLEAIEEESNRLAAEIQKLQAATSGTTVAPGIMLWPCPGQSRITSPFGNRFHPTKKVYKLHTGMDIAAPYGTPIVAAAGGTVIKAQYYGSYGNCVIIDNGGGVSTLYAHMSKILVKNGQKVEAGATIGKVGSTGASTGNHLHFEVRIGGTPKDPAGYVSYN